MLSLVRATFRVYAPDDMTEEELGRITDEIEDIDLLGKLYGAAKELIRERIKGSERLVVELE